MPVPCSQQERTETLEGVVTRIESDPRSNTVDITLTDRDGAKMTCWFIDANSEIPLSLIGKTVQWKVTMRAVGNAFGDIAICIADLIYGDTKFALRELRTPHGDGQEN